MRLLVAALVSSIAGSLLSAPAMAGRDLPQESAVEPGAPETPGRTERRPALAALEPGAPDSGRSAAITRLVSAARAGDDLALIRLEQLRRSGEPGAPSLDEIIAIEIARAEKGDPMTAWRLARRYEEGDGVPVSNGEMIRWLRIAGDEAAGDYPKARDAAYRLCEIYGRGAGAPTDLDAARLWCERAAGAGHSGAAIVIARLRGADE